MSDFNTLALLMVLTVAGYSFHFFLKTLIINRADAVVTGVIRGVSVPTKHRWLVLQNSWLSNVGGLVVFDVVLSFGWLLLARNASADDVRLLAYLGCFLGFGGALAETAQGILWYLRLSSVLREAE